MRHRVLRTSLAVVTGLFLLGCTPAPTTQSSANPSAEPDTLDPTPQEPVTPPPPPPLAWGPTQGDVDDAIDQARSLSDDELAGQIIVARYEGTAPQVPAQLVEELHLGGVILFGPNVDSLDQVIATAQAVQSSGAEAGRTWPTILAVDNEGGPVQRLSGASGEWTTFPAFAQAGEVSSEVVSAGMQAMAQELRASGMNTNYAPVADVTIGADDPTIGDRSASSDPETVADAVMAAVEGFTRGGVLTSIKHFPGHGGLNVDSHYGLPVQEASTDEMWERDLVPFVAGVEAGAPMVMMGHIDAQEWDPGVPASLSATAYDFLRTELGFTGVTITDGLDMGALEGTSGEIALTAMKAGADILLTPGDAYVAHDALVEALADGELDRGRIEEAAGRVIAMMRWQEHLAEQAGPVSKDDVGSGKEAAAALRGTEGEG